MQAWHTCQAEQVLYVLTIIPAGGHRQPVVPRPAPQQRHWWWRGRSFFLCLMTSTTSLGSATATTPLILGCCTAGCHLPGVPVHPDVRNIKPKYHTPAPRACAVHGHTTDCLQVGEGRRGHSCCSCGWCLAVSVCHGGRLRVVSMIRFIGQLEHWPPFYTCNAGSHLSTQLMHVVLCLRCFLHCSHKMHAAHQAKHHHSGVAC